MDGGVPKCPGCGYPAVRAGRAICSECGTEFDTDADPKRRRLSRWVKWTIASAALASAVFASIGCMTGILNRSPFLELIVVGFVASVLQTAVLCATALRAELSGGQLARVFVLHFAAFLICASAFLVAALVVFWLNVLGSGATFPP